MSFNNKSAMRVALIAVAAASMAACTRPKPPVETAPPATTTPPPATTEQAPMPAPTAPVTSSTATPGSVQDFVVNVGDRVYFDTDSHDVRSDATSILDAQAAWLNRYPNVRVRIEGNADERGTREYNLALGARRANSVRDYLVSRGVSSGRITTLSYGKERPIDTGTGEDAWAKNRNAGTVITEGAR